ncbi:unnamed protein product, partial [Ectocarpus sp. 12 AP-2014]
TNKLQPTTYCWKGVSRIACGYLCRCVCSGLLSLCCARASLVFEDDVSDVCLTQHLLGGLQMTKAPAAPGDRSGVGSSASVVGPPQSLSLADEVYNLSLKLAELRWQSAGNVDALRCVAQGVAELQQAFRPLHAAVEAGLAECHQANLAAVFGRRAATPR